jgi:hypothetical protein
MTARRQPLAAGAAVLACWLAGSAPALAHSGPPFPLASNQDVGPYRVSIWTDPDSTDDGSRAGRFWVTMAPAAGGGQIPADTRATITIAPADRSGSSASATAELLDGDPARQFTALLMDHEGPFRVHLAIAGSLGPAELDTRVDATYDLRPARWLLALYVMPFALVGFLWIKLLLRRRHMRA